MNKPKFTKALVILGPNGVGKTSIAYELARKLKVGEVINMDRLYIFKHFSISSGLSDALKEEGVKRHMYELLEPDQKILEVDEYGRRVKDLSIDILNHAGLPIIEGGSPKFFSGIYNQNSDNFFYPIIGLTYPKDLDLSNKMTKRVERAFDEGLIEEVESGLLKYRETKIMKEAKAIVPIVEYLDGKTTLAEAKDKIIQGCLDLSEYQLSKFKEYPEIIWIEFKSISETIEEIIRIMNYSVAENTGI